MIRIIKEIVCFLLYVWHRIFHKLPHVSSVYFHDPSPEVFERVLKWYINHHYRVISLKELKQLLERKQQPQERIAFISMDDGWRSNLDLLPICEKYNVPITVFVATEPLVSGNYWWEYATQKLGRPKMLELKKLSEAEFYAQMGEIKKGMKMERSSMTIEELKVFSSHPLITIMPHTVNHPILTNLSVGAMEKEIVESKSFLENKIGYKMDVFSYPNGDGGEREICFLKNAGFKYAMTVMPTEFDLEKNDPYLLPRRALNTYGGKYENLTKLTGIWYSVIERMRN